MKPSCILYMPRGHRLAAPARSVVATSYQILAEIDREHLISEEEAASLKPNLIVSFLNPLILRGPLLEIENINFHPAPPEYPGRGSASYALFDGASHFGATAHRMVRKVDAGEIFAVRRFPIGERDSCDQIFARSEEFCLELLKELLPQSIESALKGCGEKWMRPAGKRKDFERWLILDPTKPDEFKKKIRASKHPIFKGPYVYLHGHRFCLDDISE